MSYLAIITSHSIAIVSLNLHVYGHYPCRQVFTIAIPDSSMSAFCKSLGPTDHAPSSRSHTPSPLRVSSLCNSPLIWAGDTLDWNRDRWYRSRTSRLDEGAREVGTNWESVRRRCSGASSCVMGSEISRKCREVRDKVDEVAARERQERNAYRT